MGLAPIAVSPGQTQYLAHSRSSRFWTESVPPTWPETRRRVAQQSPESFPKTSLLSPNTEVPLVTSGKSRPLDLLLNKGLDVMGGSQRGHDFPRTAGSYSSMDVGILG